MYLPEHFRSRNDELARRLIAASPFATLVTVTDQCEPMVNHLPVILSGDRLLWHMARKNPLWREIARGQAVTLVFHGPHAYVSPLWYEENDVPTWNYAAVHVRGVVSLVEEHEALMQILREASGSFDTWEFVLPGDLADPKVVRASIVGCELLLDGARIDCKLKLSQNRSSTDQASVKRELMARGDENARGVAALMR